MEGENLPAGCYFNSSTGDAYFNRITDSSVTLPDENTARICSKGTYTLPTLRIFPVQDYKSKLNLYSNYYSALIFLNLDAVLKANDQFFYYFSTMEHTDIFLPCRPLNRDVSVTLILQGSGKVRCF